MPRIAHSIWFNVGKLALGIGTLNERFPRITKVIGACLVGVTALSIGLIAGKYAVTLFKDAYLIGKNVVMWFARVLSIARIRAISLAVAHKIGAVATGLMSAAQWALNVAMTANPIGLIIAGIAALAAGAVWAYKKFEPFRWVVDWLWQGFKKMIQYSPVGLLLKAGKALGGLLGKVIGKLFGKEEEEEKKKAPRVGAAMKKRMQEAGINELSGGASIPPGLDLEGLARGGGSRSSNIEINLGGIHAAPGMDEERLAELTGKQVAEQLAEADRHALAERRAEQYD